MAKRKRKGQGKGKGRGRSGSVRSWRTALVLGLLAAIAAVALYQGALGHPLVYDDIRTILENPSIHPPLNVKRALLYEPFRPLVNLSYALDIALQGDEPASFHRTNLILHGLVTVLLALVVTAAARDARTRSGEEAPLRPELLGGVVALLFAVHPLQTESVTYASARSEALCGVFLLASLLALARWLRTESRLALGGGFVFFVLAAASREVGAMIPVLALTWDRCLGRDDGARQRLLRVHLPWVGLIAIGGLWRVSTYFGVKADALPRPPLIHLMTQPEVIWRYLRLVVWPTGQSIVHPVDQVSSIFDPGALVASAGLLGVMGLAWRMRRSHPLEAFGVAWWFLLLAPSSSIIPLNELIAEHRVYLALGGVLVVLFSLCARLPFRVPAVAGWVLVVGTVAVLGAATTRRLAVWESPLVLWADAAEQAPSTWRAVWGRGDALRKAGDCQGAIPVLRRAVKLGPGHQGTRANLGICLAQTGSTAEARRIFTELVEDDPSYVQGLNNLGRLAVLEGDIDEALELFERSLVLDPGNILARRNLVDIHRRVRPNPAAALQRCRELRRIAPQLRGMDECIAESEARLQGQVPPRSPAG